MQVTELESQGLKRNYRIVVEADQINMQTEAELKRAGEQVKIPGFRPGFIPLKILKQRYGQSVQADVLKQVINQSSNEVLAQKKLRPALMPKINIENYVDGGTLTYTMWFEIFPEVPEMDFSKITLDRSTFDISDDDINEAAERIAERSPSFSRVKEGSKAQTGNVVTIDFKGMQDGVAFEGGSATNFRLELGGGQFIEGFEDQLLGAKEGEEREVNVTFPKDYPSEQLTGKPATFEVKIKEIQSKSTPEIDDAFAKSHGFDTIGAFKDAIREQLTKEYNQLVRNQLKKQLFDWLEEHYEFDTPQGMVELEFNSIWDRLQEAKQRGEVLEDKPEEEIKEEYQKIAQRRVTLGLLLADVGTRNKIQIGRDELSQAVLQQARMFPGQEKKVMEFYRNNPERVDDLRGPILEEKAVDLILGKVAYKDRKVSLSELTAQNEDEEEGDSAKKKSGKAKSSKSSKADDDAKKDSKPKASAKKKPASE